jgi:hypothetical protein
LESENESISNPNRFTREIDVCLSRGFISIGAINKVHFPETPEIQYYPICSENGTLNSILS